MVCRYQINDIAVYKYLMPVITSNMYILIKNGQALIIDPNKNEEAIALLQAHNIEQITIILTHEHFDHISGVNFFREHWNCTVIGNRVCEECVRDATKNLSAFFMAMFITRSEEEQQLAKSLFVEDYCCSVDKSFGGELTMDWNGMKLILKETPGHSPASICVIANHKYIFTGDSLVGGNKVITRLPGGNRKEYNQVTRPFLEGLPEDIVVFPGHGEEDIIKNFQLG